MESCQCFLILMCPVIQVGWILRTRPFLRDVIEGTFQSEAFTSASYYQPYQSGHAHEESHRVISLHIQCM